MWNQVMNLGTFRSQFLSNGCRNILDSFQNVGRLFRNSQSLYFDASVQTIYCRILGVSFIACRLFCHFLLGHFCLAFGILDEVLMFSLTLKAYYCMFVHVFVTVWLSKLFFVLFVLCFTSRSSRLSTLAMHADIARKYTCIAMWVLLSSGSALFCCYEFLHRTFTSYWYHTVLYDFEGSLFRVFKLFVLC